MVWKLKIKKNSPTPIYRQLAEFVSNAIEAGRLKPGDRIPSVVDLSRRLGVNKVSVVRAFRELEQRSLLVSRVGRGSFVSEVVEAAGGENIFGDTDRAYFEASKESIVLRAPDVVLEFHAGEDLTETERALYAEDWEALSTLPAVRDGRVYLFHDSFGLRPGPRIGLTARRIAKLLHPGLEPDPARRRRADRFTPMGPTDHAGHPHRRVHQRQGSAPG